MGTTQVAVFNRALIALGERRLASIGEPRKAQRVLTDLWGDCVQFCLEQGMWNFAMASGSVAGTGSSGLGYSYAFAKPSDLVHLFALSESGTYDPPLTGRDYADAGGSWFANVATLYGRYTSNAAGNGGNLALWTMTFTSYLVHVLAAWAAVDLTGSQAVADAMEQRAARYLVGALAIDSVPMLPGLLPFNAEARSRIAEGANAQPIYVDPFRAALPGPAQSGAQ